MTSWSPTIEGFRCVLRMPSLPLAEVAWRWSFGAAASVLIGLGVFEYLDTLPVSPGDLLMLRTGHPLLVANALSHIARGSGLRLSMAFTLLFSTLAFASDRAAYEINLRVAREKIPPQSTLPPGRLLGDFLPWRACTFCAWRLLSLRVQVV